jgi:hypothetical protein
MTYLDPKGEGDNSMSGHQRPGSVVGDGVLGGPRDMAKTGLSEAQSPADASSHPPEGQLKPAPHPASEGIQGDEWTPDSRWNVRTGTNVGSPTGRES